MSKETESLNAARTGRGVLHMQHGLDYGGGCIAHCPGCAVAGVLLAARRLSEIEQTGVLPDFQPLADALAALDGAR